MSRWFGCVVVVYGLACGSEAPEPNGAGDVPQGETGGESGETGDVSGGETGGGSAALVGECPATLEEALRSSGCAIGMQACTYERGSCNCIRPPHCGGAPPPPPVPGSQGTLSCSSQDQSVTRADGCPLSMPVERSACAQARVCDYTVCSWHQKLARCEGGQWHLEHHMSSPPP